MTETTNPNRVPAGVPTGGQFAASARAEAAVSLHQTPVHDIATLRPDVVTHVALGGGREWATLCGHAGGDGTICDEPVFGTDIGAVNSANARHGFTEHNVHGEVPIQVGEWVTSEKHGVRVSFTDLGEGFEGEYDEDDPEDQPLLRLDIQVRPEHPEAGDEDEPGWHWLCHSKGSMCTLVNAETVTGEQRRRLLNDARAQVVGRVKGGVPISGLEEHLSSMSTDDAPAFDTDEPSEKRRAEMLSRGHYDSGTATEIAWCDTCETHAGHAPHGDAWRTTATGSAESCLNCEDRKIAGYEPPVWGADGGGSYVNEHGVDLTPGQSPTPGNL